MKLRNPEQQSVRQIFSAMACLLVAIAGCSSNATLVDSRLDPLTSVRIRYSHAPLVFFRDVSGRAAYARDYIHVAPIEVNRSGSYRYYLWLGIWNTMETNAIDSARDGFESIVIYADGEPLPLQIRGWTPDVIGASKPVHVKPVASAADAYYEVTLGQLRLIAEARDLRLQPMGPGTSPYEPWDDQRSGKAGLNEFLNPAQY